MRFRRTLSMCSAHNSPQSGWSRHAVEASQPGDSRIASPFFALFVARRDTGVLPWVRCEGPSSGGSYSDSPAPASVNSLGLFILIKLWPQRVALVDAKMVRQTAGR